MNDSKKSVENNMNNNRYPESKLQSQLSHYNDILTILNAIDTEEFVAKFMLQPQTDTNAFRP